APLSYRRLHHARFLETLVASSWMVLLVGLPALLAYGVVYRAGPLFYAGAVAVLLAFFVIPAAVGVLVTTGLVLVFPARRTRDVLIVGVGLAVAALVVAVRLLRPERLADPSGLVGFASFLAGFGATGSPYLPTTWAAETLLPLVSALVAIYLYNFSALPLGDGTPLALAMRDLATILNLGLGAFVTTAVAVRFVFPMVSLEGHAWWILRTAPVPLAHLWWSKFWIGYLPLVVFAELLVATTNGLLRVPFPVTVTFLLTLVPLMAAVVSLGLAFGAAYPRLDTQNAAQIATGFGAILYMLA